MSEGTQVPESVQQKDAPAQNPDAPRGQFAVFISYSRKDGDFVRKLEDALEGSGRRAWVDHGEVLPTEDWRMSIYAGIEAADNFVFVISPDSVGSKVCADELAHALAHNKRLVPILYREVSGDAPPSPLDKLNWIFFDRPGEFDGAFQTLCSTLDTDLKHVRMHTRLLTRAIEWEGRGHDGSLMLRGSDLQEAEQWLIQSAEKGATKPTPRQTAYVIASRKAETKRQRVWLGAVLFGLAVALALAAFALVSRQTAVEQRRIAEERRAVALSRQLAVQSTTLLPRQIDLATLLALEASNAGDTTEARASLLGTLAYGPDVGAYLPAPPGDVKSVVFSPDGRTLASGHGSNILIWDADTHEPKGPPLAGHTDIILALALSPDGRTLASGGRDDLIILWDVSTGRQVGRLDEHTDFVWSLAYSPDGRFLVSGSTDGKIIFWDAATRRRDAEPLAGHGGAVFTVAFSPDGKMLASGGRTGEIVLWDVATRRELQRFTLGSPVRCMAFSHDGKTLASGGDQENILLWDVEARRKAGLLAGTGPSGLSDLAFSADDRLLASASSIGTVSLWDVAAGRVLAWPLTSSLGSVACLAFSPDGKTVAWGGDNARLGLWDTSTRRGLGLPGGEATYWVVTYSPDGTILATANEDGLLLWDAATRAQLRPPLEGLGDTALLTFSPDSKWLAVHGGAAGRRLIRIWNISAPRADVPPPTEFPQGDNISMAFSPDGKTFAIGDFEGAITFYELGSMSRAGEPLRGHDGPVTFLAYDRDGKTLISAGRDATLRLWDVATRTQRVAPFTGHTGPIWGMALSRDGTTLASASIDETVRLWDVATGRQLAVLLGNSTSTPYLDFSPDGKMLASGNTSDGCILWDVPSRQQLVKLNAEQEVYSARSVAFSPDGRTLTTGGEDVVFWDVSVESWKSRACRIANRNLTAAEWERYFGDEPRRRTCREFPLP
jgi:WD40 repeat protein